MRTMKEINDEYTQLSAKIGHCNVQLKSLNTEITRLHESVDALILEGAEVQAAAATAREKKEVQGPSSETPAI
jgi:cell division septum initiation protein DivIVA